ncbi:MAG: cellulase family glycosylhydrolase [Candidatus Roizmanbacteria bacterium]|nr:cellulase family glycosylhydrolase [Candidatus Roizmanbacteria bacterium]
MGIAPIIGSSFSQHHLNYKGISPREALEAYSQLGLSWIRLGCYWSETETTQGTYQFDELDGLVAQCKNKGINIVMTVGMKAPRWPEFYIPHWLNKTPNDDAIEPSLFSFISKTIAHFKKQKHIRYWQVENEPLDPSGPHHWVIPFDTLTKEVALVRKLDPDRKIIINCWGNALISRHYYPQILGIADVVGVDLYPRVPGPLGYHGPSDSNGRLRQAISSMKAAGKQVWISELQAEPWGLRTSCLPQHITENTQWAMQLKSDALWYWGYEYWYQRKLMGDESYWNAIHNMCYASL